MPDATTSVAQAPAASPETNHQPGSGSSPSTDQPTATTTPASTTPPTDPKALTYEEAGRVLDEAGNPAKNAADPLADPEEVDPLADPDEPDPLALGEAESTLDELLPTTEEQPTVPEAEVQPAAPVEGEVQTTPTTDEPTTTPAGENEEMPKRIRLNLEQMNARDFAVILHARKTGKSLREAETDLFGTNTPADQVTTPAATTPEPAPESPEQIKAEIESLKAERRTAAEAYDGKTQVEITEKIEAAQERLVEARARQTTAAATYESAYTESLALAQTEFPDASKPGTDLHDAILMDKKRLEQVNPRFFDDPQWPETLVFKHAGKLGITPASRAKTTPAAAATTPSPAATAPKPGTTPAAKPLPVKPARPVVSPAPGGRADAQATVTAQSIREQLKEATAKGDVAAIDRIQRYLETHKVA